MSKNYNSARERYMELGVDTEAAIKRLSDIAISMHCWQGDDVAGFEEGRSLDGGIAVTGNYPGRARNGEELRADIDFAMDLIPGNKKRLNLHAIYAETAGKKVERDELNASHFKNFIDWAADRKVGLDFNPTFFSHPKASDGFTLSNSDEGIRQFWINHGIACRKIGEEFGKKLNDCCITNFWIPDGYKDIPADRLAPRSRLVDSLDKIFDVKIDETRNKDAVECKLFGIGSESYVTGSHEFYMLYATTRNKLVCLDAGHFHPTETISDKISSTLLFNKELLLHVSRGVRWDSDHVIVLNDDLCAIAEEIVRHNFEKRVHIGLDFFDASINRIAAWVIGVRAMNLALLKAMLEPSKKLAKLENEANYTARLAMLEGLKSMPFGEVWDEFCRRMNVPVGMDWLKEVETYEKNVLSKRQ